MTEPFFSEDTNSSDNSYYFLSLEEAILKAIDTSQIELTPKEIQKKLYAGGKKVKESSVRVYVRKLLEKGLVLQPYPGAYCSEITYRVRFVPLLVHNIRLRSFVAVDVLHWEAREQVGGVVVYVCFGAERRKVSGWVSCGGGMTKDACLLALHRWFDLVEGRLGGELGEVEILSFEQNKDYRNVRLDGGLACLTKTNLFGQIERIYQKSEDTVRAEHKVTETMSVTKFESLLAAGVAGHSEAQGLFELQREVSQMKDALKFTNARVLELVRLNEALVNRLSPMDGVGGGVGKPLAGTEDYSR